MIKDHIDKTFIINLDNRSERWKATIQELKKVGISNYERFSAIKPMNVQLYEHCKMHLAGSNKAKYVISCCGVKRSHVEIIKMAKKRKYEKILVLEDDVIFHEKANLIFDQAVQQIKIDWSMLFLGVHHVQPYNLLDSNLAIIVRAYAIHAYIIKDGLFDTIIDRAIPSGKEIDVFYADEIFPRFNCLCIRPHIAWQRAGFSDILQGFRDYKVIKK